jgi:hypothetical protein
MKRKARAQNGQILVLMAMLSTTLIIMFGMVVSVGHLVEAKMNLQNAVDLAAMSGASWQARFLNHIAMVNYRMRQNYKFVLYDLYVTESRFNEGFQQSVERSPISGPFDRIDNNRPVFGICQQARGYTPIPGVDDLTGRGSQAVGTTNLCQNVIGSGNVGRTIPPIIATPYPSVNPVLIAASIAILRLSQRLQEFCVQSGGQNGAYFKYMMKNLTQRQQFQVEKIIDILQEWDGAFSDGDEVLGSNRRADRTIAETFRRNLIGANSQAELEYLNPSKTRAFRFGGNQPSEIKSQILMAGVQGSFSDYFSRQFVGFKVRFVDFRNQGGGCATVVEEGTYPNRSSPSDPQGVLLGLSRTRMPNSGNPTNKDPVLIPFSVVLRAKVQPKLLFWPRGLTPTLVAVGAAKPFGSRIGPPVRLSNLETLGRDDFREVPDFGLANMSFYPGDYGDSNGITSTGKIPGVGHKTILKLLYESLPAPDYGANRYRPSAMDNVDCLNTNGGRLPFMCASLAPTLYEGLFWNAFAYPVQFAGNSLERQAAIPSEFMNILDPPADPRYNLPDRMSILTPDPNQLRRWHYTMLIGKDSKFRQNNKPVFFADAVSVSSSWTPDLKLQGNDIDLDPTAGSVTGAAIDSTSGKTRQGYQIKLVALPELCQEIRDGGKVDPGALTPYCEGGNMKVFY